MNLRGYQQSAHDAILREFQTHGSSLVSMATGTGKTIVFAHLIKSFQPKRALVLAHRDELISQARDKIHAVTGIDAEIEKAELYANTSLFSRMPVVVSSIQTQISGKKDKRRYMRFKPEDFGLLICDEAHHAAAASWKEVVSYYRRNPDLKVLGVTATPDRADEEALGQIFESVAFEYSILDAIQDGYLVDITQQFVPVSGLDFSEIRTFAKDLNEGDLAKVMELEENIHGVCQPSIEVMFGLTPKTLSAIPTLEWRNYLAGLNKKPRRTIMFTVSVAQAEMCCNIFSRAMDGVEWVCGKTHIDDRRQILERFSKGETHAVANCGVLLEGFDNPGVEVIVMARPTKSRALYAQAIGRSTRPLPGLIENLSTPGERRAAIAASPKPYCRILDFVGNSGQHKLISAVDVLGGRVSPEAAIRAREKAISEGKPLKILVTMTKAEVDIQREKREAQERARLADEARKKRIIAKVDFTMQDVDSFDSKQAFKSTGKVSRDGFPLKEGTLAILRKLGINPAAVTKSQVQGILGDYYSRPSPPMAKVLMRAGLNPKDYNFKQALEMIGKLRANGWKKPGEAA